MRDFLPADVRKREYVIGIIKEVYESYGFEPLETPAVENLDTLMGKYGEEGNQLIFKILKRGEKLDESIGSRGRLESPGSTSETSSTSSTSKTSQTDLSDLALRYDLTVPLARVVANNRNELPKFFKRYQIQPVWRADRPARGRYREFYQCDVDAIGSNSMIVEAELISAVNRILTKLGFEFVIQVNHRQLLTALLESTSIPKALHNESFVAIDKFDKIDDVAMVESFRRLGVAKEFKQLAPWIGKFRHDRATALREASELYDPINPGIAWRHFNDKLFNDIRDRTANIVGASDALANVIQIIRLSDCAPIFFNPLLARGISYYTGSIMEINVLPSKGFDDFDVSIGGGGRYDGLIGMFGKEQIPACGFSLGLERILVVMDERNMFPPEIADSTPADVMVTIWSEETIGESLKLANELRSAGLRVTLYPEPDKLGKQIKYADSIKVPFVCVLGESELAEGKVTLKNMTTGDQQAIERTAVSAEINK